MSKSPKALKLEQVAGNIHSAQHPFLQCQGCSANVSCCHFLHSSLNSLHLSNLSFRTGVASAAAKSQRLYSKLGSSVFAAVVLGDLEVGFLFVLERLESNLLKLVDHGFYGFFLGTYCGFIYDIYLIIYLYIYICLVHLQLDVAV